MKLVILGIVTYMIVVFAKEQHSWCKISSLHNCDRCKAYVCDEERRNNKKYACSCKYCEDDNYSLYCSECLEDMYNMCEKCNSYHCLRYKSPIHNYEYQKSEEAYHGNRLIHGKMKYKHCIFCGDLVNTNSCTEYALECSIPGCSYMQNHIVYFCQAHKETTWYEKWMQKFHGFDNVKKCKSCSTLQCPFHGQHVSILRGVVLCRPLRSR